MLVDALYALLRSGTRTLKRLKCAVAFATRRIMLQTISVCDFGHASLLGELVPVQAETMLALRER